MKYMYMYVLQWPLVCGKDGLDVNEPQILEWVQLVGHWS